MSYNKYVSILLCFVFCLFVCLFLLLLLIVYLFFHEQSLLIGQSFLIPHYYSHLPMNIQTLAGDNFRECTSTRSFFLFGFSLTNIHYSQDSKGRGRWRPLPTSFYHFNPIHRHLDISRAITAKSSSLHIPSAMT